MTEQSRSSPSPPTNLPPFPPTSLASLPTEVLALILDNIPRHPSKTRFASLARICLVNKFFLSIARPLLYTDIHLNLEEDFEDDHKSYPHLFRTLTTTRAGSTLVKELRVSFFEVGTAKLDMVALSHVLSQLGPLLSIRTSWWTTRPEELCKVFIESILRHQKGLKRLEVPNLPLEYDTISSIFSTLSDLDTFIGYFVHPPESKEGELLKPICKLRRLVATSPIEHPSLLQQILSSSHSSLTSLASKSAQSMNRSTSPLSVISLMPDSSRGTAFRLRPTDDTDPLVASLADLLPVTVRPTLVSIQSLPVKTLSISTRDNLISRAIRHSPLFDILPSTLVHLSAAFPFWDDRGNNRDLLFAGVRNNAYPRLKRLSILPTTFKPFYGISTATRRIGKKHGVQVVLVRKRRQVIDTRLDLDPWQTDSATQPEDSSSDSDSTSDSSDSSETFSNSSDSSKSSISSISSISTISTVSTI